VTGPSSSGFSTLITGISMISGTSGLISGSTFILQRTSCGMFFGSSYGLQGISCGLIFGSTTFGLHGSSCGLLFDSTFGFS
jgi:hypothetical protein